MQFCRILFVAFVCLGTSFKLQGQIFSDASTTETLNRGTIVASNVDDALRDHLLEDPNFRLVKQLPEEKRELPKMLPLKDGSFIFDWTPGQQARYLMEGLRQGLHQLQSVEKLHGLDIPALAGAREYWPKLRDISCHESPGIRYYDLDGFKQYCPTK